MNKDSEAIKDQKIMYLEEIKNLVSYLKTHGLERIHLADLKDAHRALDRMKVDGFE